MDSPDIRKLDFIQTYYSGKKTPTDGKNVTLPRPKKPFDKRLWINAVFLLALVSGAAIIITYLLGIKARPISIRMSEIPALSSGGDYSNVGYYDYQQAENKQAPITLKPGRSCVALNFSKALDLTAGSVSFSAKGEDGAEKIAIILRDTQQMSNANRNDIILTPALFDNQWHYFKVELKDLYLPLDKSRITQVRFDLSAKLTKNNPQAVAHIKDVIIK